MLQNSSRQALGSRRVNRASKDTQIDIVVEAVEADNERQIERLVRGVCRLTENELLVARGTTSVGSAIVSSSRILQSTPKTFVLQCHSDTAITTAALQWLERGSDQNEPYRGVLLFAPDARIIQWPAGSVPCDLSFMHKPRPDEQVVTTKLILRKFLPDPWGVIRKYLYKRSIAFYWWDLLKRLMNASLTARILFPHESPAYAGVVRDRDLHAYLEDLN